MDYDNSISSSEDERILIENFERLQQEVGEHLSPIQKGIKFKVIEEALRDGNTLIIVQCLF